VKASQITTNTVENLQNATSQYHMKSLVLACEKRFFTKSAIAI